MEKSSTKFVSVVLGVFACLVIPAFFLSVTTKFRLIDDYGEAMTLPFDYVDLKTALRVLKSLFFDADALLWRPWFFAKPGLTWGIFGDRPWLHHAFYFLMVLAAGGFIWKSVTFFEQAFGEVFKKGNLILSRKIPHLFALAIFVFYPNRPEARIFTPESFSLFFGAWLLYSVLGWIKFQCEFKNLNRHALGVFFATMLLSWTKEPNLSIVIGTILIVAMTLIWNRAPLKNYLLLVGLLLLGFYHAYMIIPPPGDTYGLRPSYKMLLSLGRWQWVFRDTTWVKLCAMLAPFFFCSLLLFPVTLILKQKKNVLKFLTLNRSLTLSYLYVLGTFIGFWLTSLMNPFEAMRYVAPLTIYISMFWAVGLLSLASLEVSVVRARWFAGVSTGLMLWFVGVTYTNYILQFDVQRRHSIIEDRAMRCLAHLAKQGYFIAVQEEGNTPQEQESKVRLFINFYLEYYRGQKRPEAGWVVPEKEKAALFRRDYDKPIENMTLHREYDQKLTPFYDATLKVSKLFGNTTEQEFDAGVVIPWENQLQIFVNQEPEIPCGRNT